MRTTLTSTDLAFLIIFACLLDVASAGRMRSASPCRMSVGTVLRGMSWRKSSIHVSTQVEVVMLPLTYAVVRFLKDTEHVDHYDYGTRFNPLVLR